MIALTDLTPSEIAAQLTLKPFQGKQIFQWLHRKRVFTIDDMTNLSKALRERLRKDCVVQQLEVVETARSGGSTGTRKLLFRTRDNETVESVLLHDRERVTLCLSTQVGCPLNCAFCATGASGFARNLSPGEIVEQALQLIALEPLGERTPNIVYMGMGEPFLNYDAVVKSIRLLMSKDGVGVGARKITVSTVGDVPGIQRFAQENWQVRLSISLHAARDDLRSKLVPLNRKYPIKALMDAVKDYITQTGRQMTFEWTLLGGVNDTARDAEELARLVGRLKATVNLIPYNPVPGSGFEPPKPDACEQFLQTLQSNGVPSYLRRERGGDIDAACGQLRRRKAEGK